MPIATLGTLYLHHKGVNRSYKLQEKQVHQRRRSFLVTTVDRQDQGRLSSESFHLGSSILLDATRIHNIYFVLEANSYL